MIKQPQTKNWWYNMNRKSRSDNSERCNVFVKAEEAQNSQVGGDPSTRRPVFKWDVGKMKGTKEQAGQSAPPETPDIVSQPNQQRRWEKERKAGNSM